jgi:hypothetical protein
LLQSLSKTSQGVKFLPLQPNLLKILVDEDVTFILHLLQELLREFLLADYQDHGLLVLQLDHHIRRYLFVLEDGRVHHADSVRLRDDVFELTDGQTLDRVDYFSLPIFEFLQLMND